MMAPKGKSTTMDEAMSMPCVISEVLTGSLDIMITDPEPEEPLEGVDVWLAPDPEEVPDET